MLHTSEYARANHENSMPKLGSEQIEMHIEAKLIRQRILTQADPQLLCRS